jgi:hypothetical protein
MFWMLKDRALRSPDAGITWSLIYPDPRSVWFALAQKNDRM